ncbi:MAG: phenylalanine--tRNA ligase subunit beta [Pseudomonadota bacterium]
MKFSEAWLREWVDPGLPRDELLSQLTMAGLEVDGVEPVAGEFTGVVVGQIVSSALHPDADKLKVCQVSDGSETVQVVCGAPNAREGLLTAFARVGALLPENFKIKKAKLRGVESFGMLCSAQELGLGEDHDGIMELPTELNVGADLVAALQLDDVTIDVDLTPNRGDCLSLKGLAREVGVLNNQAVAYPQITPVPPVHDETFPVSLADPAACPRYLGRVIKNVDLSRSTPHWMAERLRRCGLRSIDPVVDVTNYVLIELGQPMHAFDLHQLSGEIVVRKPQGEEKLVLLDGQEVTLDADTLLITDANGPVAMGGVMGGERSGVSAQTKDVFLECAFFAPLAIAGTARRYGLHTDASHRYERGVDYALQRDAVEHATRLLLDMVGGEPGPILEAKDEAYLPEAAQVTVRQSRINDLLGIEISPAQVDDAFTRLDFQVSDRQEEGGLVSWTIRSPSHRFDIAIEADLIEEVCRIYGYNNVVSKQPTTDLALRSVPLERSEEAKLKAHLADVGMQEVITYSFVDPGLQDLLDPGTQTVALANPMSQDQSIMRTNLLCGMVAAAQANVARQQDRVRIFELGLVFRPDGDQLAQPQMLGGLLWGRRSAEVWHAQNESVDFFDAKGIVENLAAWSGVPLAYEPCDNPVFHPGQSAAIGSDGRTVGVVGRLHPEVESRVELSNVFVFELDSNVLLDRPRRVYSGVSRYPSVRRDLAIVVDKKVDAAKVEGIVRQIGGGLLVDFRLFDVYEGKGIDSNEKSLGLGLTLQSQSATLTDAQINDTVDQIVQQLADQIGAKLR